MIPPTIRYEMIRKIQFSKEPNSKAISQKKDFAGFKETFSSAKLKRFFKSEENACKIKNIISRKIKSAIILSLLIIWYQTS